MRRIALSIALIGSLGLAACGSESGNSADTTTAPTSGSGNDCTAGKTLADGKLTIATGNPAYEPWVVNDAPESGEGFEAAVAYAVAGELGFGNDNVEWVRTDFESAIQPGAKNFDFNLQQFTISDERKQTVGFSEPYYRTNQAVVIVAGSAAAGATSVADLKNLKIGVQAGTTSLSFVQNVIQPSEDPFVYNDNAEVKAAFEADQIDALVADLPTAFYMAAAELTDATVLGQFATAAGDESDAFGLLTEKDSPLLECLDAALTALTADGTLDALAAKWLSESTNVPVLGR